MKLTRKVMWIYALIFLNGCARNEYVSCIGWMPIYLGRQDYDGISSGLARDILKHNENGKRSCGWKPINKKSG
nr:hypothetical protein [Bartonella schoenbuchensis]